MRTELVWMLIATSATGCISTSIRDDRSAVERLTAQELHDAVLDDVHAESEAEARRLVRRPLTPQSALQIAMTQNRELRATLRELGIERGRVLQASLLPNPTFEFDLRHQEDREQPLQAEFYLEYDLTDALLTPLRVEAAHRDLDAARFAAAAAAVRTAYAIRAAYYEAQAAEQELSTALRALEAIAAARDAAVALFEAGNTAELDVASQIAAYEEARADVALLELARTERREALNRLLGLHGEETTWTFAGTLEPPSEREQVPDTLETTAIERSLELAEARQRLEGSARRIGLSRTRGWLPDVSVDAHVEQDGQTWEIGGGARVSLPFFDHREGDTASYEAEFDAALERFHGTAIEVRSAARVAAANLASARARATQYERVIVPARRRVFEQTLLQYNAMQLGVFSLIDALRAQLDAELAAIAARRDYWTARAAVEALLRGARVDVARNDRVFRARREGSAGGGH